MKFVRFSAALLIASTVAVQGQSGPQPIASPSGVTGSWSSDGAPFLNLVLESSGTGVTGAVSRCSSAQYSPTVITEGHLDGDVVTFRCTSPDGGRTVAFVGRLSGDEIVFTWNLQVRAEAPPPSVFDPFGPLPGRRIQGPPRFTVKRAPDATGESLLKTARGSREATARSPVTFDRILTAGSEPQNWLTYSGNLLGHRFSALAEVTPANVKELELAWVWRQAPTAGRLEATPLVVDGLLYTVQSPNDVVALDAATGDVRWVFRYAPNTAALASSAGGRINRGLAIVDNLLFMGTLDAHLLAIDAATGQLVWNATVADPTDPSCQVPNGWTYCYNITMAPLVVKDKVIVGVGGGDGDSPGFGIRGFIAAFDTKTGNEVWRFHTIPGPGEPGHQTWSGDSWKTGGAGVWLTGSYDAALNQTYWGTGNPTPANGDTRLGDNLFSDAVVALDADTGELKWHYQFTPHDEIDWDAAQIPVLADLEWQGQPRKLMLWANKNRVMYVLDRETGRFLSGRPFADAPWLTGFDESGRPLLVPGGLKASSAGITLSGTNWNSPSFSPSTGFFYIPVRERTGPGAGNGHGSVQAFDPATGERRWEFRRPDAWFHSVLTTASGVLFAGVWGDPGSGAAARREDGYFYALEARTGEMLWRTSLGGSVFGGGPITYAAGGRQFVAVTAGDVLFAFALRQ